MGLYDKDNAIRWECTGQWGTLLRPLEPNSVSGGKQWLENSSFRWYLGEHHMHWNIGKRATLSFKYEQPKNHPSPFHRKQPCRICLNLNATLGYRRKASRFSLYRQKQRCHQWYAHLGRAFVHSHKPKTLSLVRRPSAKKSRRLLQRFHLLPQR